MAVNLTVLLMITLGCITGAVIAYGIRLMQRKKTNEPEQDERTQKVAGKSAQMTLVVIMGVLAIIGWGDILELFKLRAAVVVSLVFLSLLISIIGFSKYYRKKGEKI